jgi:ribonuclease-3
MAIEADAKIPARGPCALEARIGYAFRDCGLMELALTHSSVAYEQTDGGARPADNERMEFLGDAVLSLAVTEYIFRRFQALAEGDLTRLRAQIVSRDNLHRVARSIALGEFLRLGKGEERTGGRAKSALLADAVEALIAAIYLDGGLKPAVATVKRLVLGPEIDRLAEAVLLGETEDSKSSLQEHLQRQGLGHPDYRTILEEGPAHDRRFVVEVAACDAAGLRRPLATGTGTRKKSAEQQAARQALALLAREPGEPGATV